jgi:glutathione S-transferase
LRARWALEEAGVPYAVRRLDAANERPADYFAEQPFGQVPSYRDGHVSLFESGAIVLHIGCDCEALLSAGRAARARATAWLIAAAHGRTANANRVESHASLTHLFYSLAGSDNPRRIRGAAALERQNRLVR